MTVRTCDLPADAFLRRYARDGGYTDCYMTEVPGHIPLSLFVEAFYTSWLFKVERVVLSLTGHYSTDTNAAELARCTSSCFAAWRVEDRGENQLLMSDVTGRTRSWFKIATISGDKSMQTLLYFGSGITAAKNSDTGRLSIGPVFKALMGFHKLYSRALLAATRRKIASSASKMTA
ncbi:hypothetical protein [Roseinatronobacter alkalisoli]|uniref:DUF2867 domain-containing protein n=1 Tax=Roseinatronobacter alkalisoli TaxID=3028235 RepID=A0ABT5TGQ0_9RHOB|nr:hypothetical protein [Roseinatronobacter sp. HJB301]MDD7973865.1 hypothetical protein [Roseinatronobacter sp. HJB301]